jgi:hypothetical protein
MTYATSLTSYPSKCYLITYSTCLTNQWQNINYLFMEPPYLTSSYFTLIKYYKFTQIIKA